MLTGYTKRNMSNMGLLGVGKTQKFSLIDMSECTHGLEAPVSLDKRWIGGPGLQVVYEKSQALHASVFEISCHCIQL
jgi:hypothetical protein